MGIFPEDTGTEGDIMGLFDFIHSICDITKNMGRQWDTNGEKNRILGGNGFPKSDKKWGMGQKTSVGWGRCRSDESWDDRAHTY